MGGGVAPPLVDKGAEPKMERDPEVAAPLWDCRGIATPIGEEKAGHEGAGNPVELLGKLVGQAPH